MCLLVQPQCMSQGSEGGIPDLGNPDRRHRTESWADVLMIAVGSPHCSLKVGGDPERLLVGSRPIHLKLPIPVQSSNTRVSNMGQTAVEGTAAAWWIPGPSLIPHLSHGDTAPARHPTWTGSPVCYLLGLIRGLLCRSLCRPQPGTYL